jgi:2-C-methyl-D-erythritol 4-phosphate cytidylyltransferase
VTQGSFDSQKLLKCRRNHRFVLPKWEEFDFFQVPIEEFITMMGAYIKMEWKESFISAIIVAAGSSSRMQCEGSKVLLPLCGEPALVHTVRAFQNACSIREIIVVCRSEDLAQFASILKPAGDGKQVKLAAGGGTRQESVLLGIAQADEQATHYAVHDGARALVLPELIDQVAKEAMFYHAAAAAVPVKDTIKVVDRAGFVVDTPERSSLWSVQTPQIFERSLYMRAAAFAEQMEANYTDDCQMVEQLGESVRLCMGDYGNLKLTTPDDLLLAEQILEKRSCKR